MHVLQSALDVARQGFRQAPPDDHALCIRITNGTAEATLRQGPQPIIGAGRYSSSFSILTPGQAGVVRFTMAEAPLLGWASTGCRHAGALELFLGGERIFLAESHPLGQKVGAKTNRFALQFCGAGDTDLDAFYRALPQEFMGLRGARALARGGRYVACVTATTSREADVVLLDADSWEAETLTSQQRLHFAEWCQEHKPDCLGPALLLADFAAVVAGLHSVSPADRAFTLDLLITAFVTSGVLHLGEGVAQMNMGLWRQQRVPHAHSAELPEYALYAGSDAGPREWRAHIEGATLLLRVIACECLKRLSEAAAACKACGAWALLGDLDGPASGRVMKRCSTHIDEEEEPRTGNDTFLAEHLAGTSFIFAADPAASPSPAPSPSVRGAATGHADMIKRLVRHCIQTSVDSAIRLEALYTLLMEGCQSEEERAGLQHLRRWLPVAVRHYHSDKSDELPEVWFRSYSSEIFGNLDGGQATKPAQVLKSLGNAAVEYKTLATNSKSGEFFFISNDKCFLVKTVSEPEGLLLQKMLPAYQEHLAKWPQSMIVRYAGVFHVEAPTVGVAKYFTIMRSVFDPAYEVHATYDLKGSLFQRRRKAGESIGKDEDWLEAKRHLRLPPALRRQVCALHELDAGFMLRFGVMDYSLLVGIHDLDPGDGPEPGWMQTGPGLVAADRSAIYFVGLIDFLIDYGLRKQAEHLVRVAQGRGEEASCVSPETYATRQVRFVREAVMEPEPPEDDTGTSGVLRVHLLEADRLMAMDWSGTSDPYVCAKLGLMTRRGPTVWKNCNPRWDCTLFLPVNEHHADGCVELTVWDEDNNRAIRGNDDFLGRLSVPMAWVLSGPQELANEPLLDARHGRLSVRLIYERLEAD